MLMLGGGEATSFEPIAANLSEWLFQCRSLSWNQEMLTANMVKSDDNYLY